MFHLVDDPDLLVCVTWRGVKIPAGLWSTSIVARLMSVWGEVVQSRGEFFESSMGSGSALLDHQPQSGPPLLWWGIS